MFSFNTLQFFLWDISDKLPSPIRSAVSKWRLLRLVRYAQKNVTYYQNVLADQDVTWKSFASIPVLTRSIVRDHNHDLVNYDLPAWMFRNKSGTSGSTGEPVQFYRTTFSLPNATDELSYLYNNSIRRVIEKYSIEHVLHTMRRVDIYIPSTFQIEEETDINSNFLFINPDELQHHPEEVVTRVIAFAPKMFGCYGSITLEFCSIVDKMGLAGTFSIPYIRNVGESLNTEQRAYIEKMLGGHVYDIYSTEEFWTVAREREGSKGLVSFSNTSYVEILDDLDQPVAIGDEGRIIITDLTNYTMPLIRYDTGDIGVMLGRSGAQTHFELKGRNRHFTLNGKLFGHFDINALFAEYAHLVTQYQIVKKTETAIAVNIATKEGDTTLLEKDIRQVMKVRIGESVSVQINFSTALPRIGRGKTVVYIDETAQ
jgi:phenylacetate-CoA ligase